MAASTVASGAEVPPGEISSAYTAASNLIKQVMKDVTETRGKVDNERFWTDEQAQSIVKAIMPLVGVRPGDCGVDDGRSVRSSKTAVLLPGRQGPCTLFRALIMLCGVY